MLSPKVEESRIHKALRDCKEHGFEVYAPIECIKTAIDKFGDKLAVSCSFGRCSVAVLHMALQLNPEIPVIFNNTTVQFPETYEYRDRLVEEWNINLIETKPVKPFWDVIKEEGLPLMRKAKGSLGKPKCCWYCKDLPLQLACQKHGITANLTGLRVAESRARMFIIAQKGQFYFRRTRGEMWQLHPITFWDSEEVNSYMERVQIPLNPVYEKYGLERLGCMPCTAYLGWEKVLAKTNPKMYRYVQKLRGVSLIDDFLSLEDEAFNGCNQASPRKGQAFLEEWF